MMKDLILLNLLTGFYAEKIPLRVIITRLESKPSLNTLKSYES